MRTGLTAWPEPLDVSSTTNISIMEPLGGYPWIDAPEKMSDTEKMDAPLQSPKTPLSDAAPGDSDTTGDTSADTCPVCLEALTDTVWTDCDHVFCPACMDATLGRNSLCPLCRHEISSFSSASGSTTVKTYIRTVAAAAHDSGHARAVAIAPHAVTSRRARLLTAVIWCGCLWAVYWLIGAAYHNNYLHDLGTCDRALASLMAPCADGTDAAPRSGADRAGVPALCHGAVLRVYGSCATVLPAVTEAADSWLAADDEELSARMSDAIADMVRHNQGHEEIVVSPGYAPPAW